MLFIPHRRGIALACLGGPIYAVGGLDDSTCFNNVERYDIESDTWSFVQPMLMPRGGVAIATLKVRLLLECIKKFQTTVKLLFFKDLKKFFQFTLLQLLFLHLPGLSLCNWR